MKRTPLKRKRSVFVPPPGEQAAYWKAAVCAGGCKMKGMGRCEGPVQGHHLVKQQHLRKLDREEFLWAVPMGMALCELHHTRVTRHMQKVPQRLIPPPSRQLMQAVLGDGFDDYLRRYFDGP